MSTTIQIADKPTLDSVSTKVGNTNDTGGTSSAGTVMGKLNKVLENQEVGSGSGAVKSVQRGVSKITFDDASNIATQIQSIDINTVNPDKCILLIELCKLKNSAWQTSNVLSTGMPILKEFKDTSIDFTGNEDSYGHNPSNPRYYTWKVVWQVIEFY